MNGRQEEDEVLNRLFDILSLVGDRIVAAAMALLLATQPASAWSFDPFRTESNVPPLVAADMLGKADVCRLGVVGQPLILVEAIERALCANPKTREAWANVKLQAAAIGAAEAAYLPVLSGSAQAVRDRSATNVVGQPQLSTSQVATQRSGSLTLSWVLYDFGGRSAALDTAVALFSAAQANHQAVLQSMFATVARDYYAAQAAQGNLLSARDIERTADESLKAATHRVSNGVAPISDQLQAETSLAQAIVSRVKLTGDWQIALGTLAADMALDTYYPITLPAVYEGLAPQNDFKESVAALIQDAKQSHPSVKAAQAQLEAADARALQARSEGLPSLSLVARQTRNDNAVSPGFGGVPVPAIGKDAYVGVQLSIPIFEGFLRTYQIRQAEFQRDAQRAVVAEAEQKVGLDVWSSYQSLNATTENVSNSARLLMIAERSYSASRYRYESGVGNILELLNAQSSLATAQRQRVQSLTDWRTARLQLASALGRLGMWSDEFTH